MIQLRSMKSLRLLLSLIIAFALDMMAYACVFPKSELLFRDRLNLSTTDRYLVAEELAAPGVPVPVGGLFFVCWSLEKLLEVSVQAGLRVQALLQPFCGLLHCREQEPGWEGGQDLRGRGTGSQVGHCLL